MLALFIVQSEHIVSENRIKSLEFGLLLHCPFWSLKLLDPIDFWCMKKQLCLRHAKKTLVWN